MNTKKFRSFTSCIIIFLTFFFVVSSYADDKVDLENTLTSHDPGANPGGTSTGISNGGGVPIGDQAQATSFGMGNNGRTIQGTVKVTSTLNVRSSAWGTIIGSLSNGAKVNIVGTSGDWYQIEYNGQTAYVHRDYISTADSPAGRVPVKKAVSNGNNPDSHNTGVTVPKTVAPGRGRFGGSPSSPKPTRASSEFGPRKMFGSKFHYGIDLPMPNGTRLNSLGDGIVIAVGHESAGGNFLKIRYDNGLESTFCHLQRSLVSNGQRVTIGQAVALSDTTGTHITGPHLHLGIKRNGTYVNPRSIQGLELPGR
ncbi:MAG: peptidoglycan DD-metalloendopeptidase family protein [Candidatus Riflebacteria bacterium]|nr:peptidoglycan DD-metalloendopeptidase family protein [Candidatus Riflebacteria bacterium]